MPQRLSNYLKNVEDLILEHYASLNRKHTTITQDTVKRLARKQGQLCGGRIVTTAFHDLERHGYGRVVKKNGKLAFRIEKSLLY